MARLPKTGEDEGTWGDILNEYLLIAHDSSGGLKPNTVATQQILGDTVTEAKLSPTVRAKLNASADVQIRSSGVALEWRTTEEETWHQLVDLEDITGPQGAPGPQGAQGAKGDVGDVGPQGIQGVPGAVGPQGAQGLAGPQGVQGAMGSVGPQGLKGDTGSAGAQGQQGATGAQGPQGVPGVAGPQGATGPGLASGGTTGQVLVKSSNSNYVTSWSDASALMPTSQVTTLSNVTGEGSFAAADAFRIIKIQASAACRFRMYRSVIDRTTDASREYTSTAPTDGSILAEYRWEDAATFWASGFVCNLDPGQTAVYWRVDDGTATLTIEWVREAR